MCRHEIFQDVQSFTEIRLDRQLDRVTGRIRHQSAHAGQLLDLLVGTTGSGVGHHENIVVLIEAGKQIFRQLIIRLLPRIYNSAIALGIRRKTSAVLHIDFVDSSLCLGQQVKLLLRYSHVRNGNRHAGSRRITVSHRLDIIQHLSGPRCTMNIDDAFQDLLLVLLFNQLVDFKLQLVSRNGTIDKSQILRYHLVKQEPAKRRFYKSAEFSSVRHLLCNADADPALKRNILVLVGQNGFIQILEDHSLPDRAGAFLCQIVDSKNHILRWNRDHSAIRRLQEIVR